MSRPSSNRVSYDRPSSTFEDLSLDDDEDQDVHSSALGPVEDPWSPKQPKDKISNSFITPSSSNATVKLPTPERVEAGPSNARAYSPSVLSVESVSRDNASTLTGYTSGSGAGMDNKAPGGGTSRNTKIVEVEVKDDTPIVLGVAVVDFNHLIGPTVEWAYPPNLMMAIQDDETLARTLPFLALPDGAHLSEEDYSFFHCNYEPSDPASPISAVPSNCTLFGISCNRQLASSNLLRRPSDVTRSMVQKAVVVIASQPVFGPIRDKLGVVTRAYFAQRDFTQTDILEDFYSSLEDSLEGKATEAAIYIGTSLRELIHKFRHRTLVLLKMLILQKKIMLYGYPVEMLCTYQYSLVSLVPGLLLALQDSGAPFLERKTKRVRPTSLKSSDRSSLLRYMGLPLQLFGRDSLFQPYLPLQQMDNLMIARSWLVGTTNQIVTQQKDCQYDLLVNIDTMSFEFSDPKIERMVALTPSDRRWMDDVVRTVEESFAVPEGERSSYKGSDDDLRARFEEYICAALAATKYGDFLTKGKASDISITGLGDYNVLEPFSYAWLHAFKKTPAGEVWDACTDPCLFDICEPKHPCEGKPNMVSDLSLRLTEGMHDLKIDQTLETGREVLSSAWTTGSTTLFKAFDGVRNEVANRLKEREEADRIKSSSNYSNPSSSNGNSPAITASPQFSVPPQLRDVGATLGGIGAGIGGFFGSKVAGLRGVGGNASSTTGNVSGGQAAGAGAGNSPPKGLRPMSLSASASAGSLKNKGR